MKYAEGAVHFVYYLYDDEYEEGPLKVGRSKWPRGRRRSFLSGTGIDTRMRVVGPFEFEEARNLEPREIKRLHPPYNKYAASSRGNIGVPMPAHVRKVLHVTTKLHEKELRPHDTACKADFLVILCLHFLPKMSNECDVRQD
jgi:hypothetical protein